MKHALLVFALSLPCGGPEEPAPARTSPARAAPGKVFLTVPEALALAFPECTVERGTVYLTKAQEERVRALSRSPGDDDVGIAHPYAARRDGKLVGTAYFDTHTVRSLRETLMVVVSPASEIVRVEVLAFGEPLDYLPRGKWYGQFPGRKLDDELDLNRGIRGVTGATLTARATTRTARRALALHAVLNETQPVPPPEASAP